MQKLQKFWTEVTNFIIRPQRSSYRSHQLGKPRFRVNGIEFKRIDITLENPRGLQLQCSHFVPADAAGKIPCVIYLHGNCGSRLDSFEILRDVLSLNMSVFAFDCSGSGQSEGEFISLGVYEKHDLAVVVDYLQAQPTVSAIGVWGRSMGAATALLYTAKDSFAIGALVLDSPFSSLSNLMTELVTEQRPWVPKVLIHLGLKAMRRTVLNKASFDIHHVDPAKAAIRCDAPALFCHGAEDGFVLPRHCQLVFNNYGTGHPSAPVKDMVLIPGDHNDTRPQEFLESAALFLLSHLHDYDASKRRTAACAAESTQASPLSSVVSPATPNSTTSKTSVTSKSSKSKKSQKAEQRAAAYVAPFRDSASGSRFYGTATTADKAPRLTADPSGRLQNALCPDVLTPDALGDALADRSPMSSLDGVHCASLRCSPGSSTVSTASGRSSARPPSSLQSKLLEFVCDEAANRDEIMDAELMQYTIIISTFDMKL